MLKDHPEIDAFTDELREKAKPIKERAKFLQKSLQALDDQAKELKEEFWRKMYSNLIEKKIFPPGTNFEEIELEIDRDEGVLYQMFGDDDFDALRNQLTAVLIEHFNNDD